MDREFMAHAMIEADETNGYEKFRQAVISHFTDTTNAILACRICRISLVLPADQTTMSRLIPLYDLMIGEQRNTQRADFYLMAFQKPWNYLSLALVDYRRGDYLKSIEWSQQSLAGDFQIGQTAAAQAILAMAYHQLHQEADARAALNNGRKANAATGGHSFLGAFGKTGSLNTTGDFYFYQLFDGLFGQELLNEASRLIAGGPPPGGGSYAVGRYDLAQLYASGTAGVPKDENEAVKWYHKAVDGGSVLAMNDLAWLLATCQDAQLRDGSNAVVFAEAAVATTNRRNPEYLDTLAAAYAETGQFEKAIAIQKEAIVLITSANTSAYLKSALEAHLKLYQSGKRCRE
jgi:TPR repeat protein